MNYLFEQKLEYQVTNYCNKKRLTINKLLLAEIYSRYTVLVFIRKVDVS